MRTLIITVIFYILYYVDAKPIPLNTVCRFGRITNIGEYTWKYGSTSRHIIPGKKVWKVVKLGGDVSNKLLDTDNYNCYVCDLNKQKEKLPYLSNCEHSVNNVTTHNNIGNVLKVMVCNKPTNKQHKKVIYSKSEYYDIRYGIKKVYTASVVVCLIEKEYTWKFTIGYIILYILVLLVIFISLMPLTVLYKLFKSGDIKEYESLDEENDEKP
ncbi:hypothetical protein fgpv_040 [Flamingopox virus FGPVKD09]|uniref:Uncharacterized protein n=1 Tax=Flamingopox virus FGPVKD09 TaxID=2059380 RepID=A0A2H4X250_9POXV|nr:hypothetical protein C1178_gp040 [Flamingopox virus FGPVKD09]AUD40145.1 hypothetical protein fgpv_040 [Flamingopox virus FGPVKD09]